MDKKIDNIIESLTSKASKADILTKEESITDIQTETENSTTAIKEDPV